MSKYTLPPSTVSNEDVAPGSSRREFLIGLGAGTIGLGLGSATSLLRGPEATGEPFDALLRSRIKRVLVIFAENRSFNNLFADFPGVASPLAAQAPARLAQRDRDGSLLAELPPVWQGMVPVAQTIDGVTWQLDQSAIRGLPNAPFALQGSNGEPLPYEVITRDLVHLFYPNQAQINAGRNDGFVAWGDSGALVMGHYSHHPKPLHLHRLAQEYTLCDNFFMGAFGGSFLNHQFLICARAPHYPDAHSSPARTRISILDGDDPLGVRLALHPESPATALEGPPRYLNNGSLTPDGYAVDTMLPPFQPSFVEAAPGGERELSDPASPRVLPPQRHLTIGDLLSRQGVDWAWYAGGWQEALDGRGRELHFQPHHQPFNYFADYAPGTAARAHHLRDGGYGNSPQTNKLLADIAQGNLPAVTFYKPQGDLNLHAGYADLASGDEHIAVIVDRLRETPQWQETLVIVTFDENGGWWDHVAPPPADRWGPGSRIPALLISPWVRKGHVDHAFYDTTSIIRFLSRLHGLPSLPGVLERDQALAAAGQPPLGDLTAALDLS